MGGQIKLELPSKLWNETKNAIKHFIVARNSHEKFVDYHNFNTTYVSNIIGYATFVEFDQRFNQSIIDMHKNETHSTMINFAS